MKNIKDVAEYAGVSASTVSRVLSGKSYVNEKTRAHVQDAVRALNYSPNGLAKSLKMGRSNTIALMIPSIQNQIFPDIARGVEDTARKNGLTVILCNTDEDVDVEKRYIEKLKTRWTDGFIVASMLPTSDHIRELRREGFPVVLASRCYGNDIDAVVVENRRAARDAVKYLLRMGHKRVAVALGREELNIYKDRYEGYCDALRDANMPLEESLVMRETNGSNSFYQLTRRLMESGAPPDAIFATSDPKAIVILHALHDMNVRVPEDVSLLGFDNIDIAALMEPPLSTVSQPLYDMGVLAAKKLIHQIRYKEQNGCLPEPTLDVMHTDLIVRKSTR